MSQEKNLEMLDRKEEGEEDWTQLAGKEFQSAIARERNEKKELARTEEGNSMLWALRLL